MCGRTACTLDPGDVVKALCYKHRGSNKYVKPEWRNVSNGGKSYRPSHNVCPTDVTPVLLSGSHFNSESERIVVPMMWGIIPPWHKGDYKSHKLSTNNCRIENLQNSKLYKNSLVKGQRCVVVCDGFYEWQTTKGKTQKQPFFIYMPQYEGIKIEDCDSWNMEYNEDQGWKGPDLLKMAAIFDSWTSTEGEEYYCYSVITLDSHETFSWIHHRMPAILDSEELVSYWLDSDLINTSEALSILKSKGCLMWHPVSTTVNNARNKDISCNKPIKDEKKTLVNHKGANFLKSWLQSSESKRTSEEPAGEECPSKIIKSEVK